ncbi:MAG: tRNA preQ1(34) S-adenosylmethionine ribosyltransferase-isomerase QueA [Oscillospiraceae bacterium]|nr:tRNA preQ1(34) S-adenosylmethionine ribosyltransferase-isomerase QueA [Oscillospiraceae bacterium]
MKKSDFWFDLPEEQIAQTPVEPRDHSRLLRLDKNSGQVSHHHFYDIVDMLRPGDLLVVNDSRVLPARLYGTKKDTGAAIELLLLEQKEQDLWETLVKPGKKCRVGAVLTFGEGLLEGTIEEVLEGGNRLIRFSHDPQKSIYEILEQIGQMPLPPYITAKLEDRERYQTVYSNEIGSAAAPTAGLHFTQELMQRIEDKGVKIARVTLHVGLGTFRPVKEEEITDHKMHSEHYHLPAETAALINETKAKGGRVIAVGTTSCRTLETCGQLQEEQGFLQEADGWTQIFIYPGYRFRVLDGLITNFHLPESTLIMLVSALAGYDETMAAYKVAVEEKYRFFSFGDAMAILD